MDWNISYKAHNAQSFIHHICDLTNHYFTTPSLTIEDDLAPMQDT